ncbi:hypothetical protein SK128_018161, partial [Halocaridina rubra]
ADSGRGGAEVWTKESLDREECKEIYVGVLLSDAGGLTDIQFLQILIDDVNDNPMKPGAKTVYLWKTQNDRLDAPLGRVYVDDADDWDIGDKVFEWGGPPHALFTLNAKDGTIYASSQIREGRYDLHFVVSDIVWGQKDVAANVTVIVRILSQTALAHSTPIILMPATPAQLTAGWTPMASGGRLGKLTQSIGSVIGESEHSVEVVSLYEYNDEIFLTTVPKSFDSVPADTFLKDSSMTSKDGFISEESISEKPAAACVWISVTVKDGQFMDPVKLRGILGMNTDKLQQLTNYTVLLDTPTAVNGRNHHQHNPQHSRVGDETLLHNSSSSSSSADFNNPSSAASRASNTLPLQVVDANYTSFVTPHLSQASYCINQEPETCTHSSCLNGGRCIKTSLGSRYL